MSFLRHICIFVLLCLPVLAADAQVLKGLVTDARDGKPLHPVTVVNIVTQHSTYTDENGEFSISAKSGEQLAFTFMGYKTVQRITPPALNISSMHVEMLPLTYQLDEVIIRGLSDYQKDSIERRETYSRVLSRQKVTSVMSPVSFIADRISKKSRMAYNFQKSFYYWENQHFIDSRYTPELVQKLTSLTGDSLAHFMNANPMPADYARSATELELKMWVRDHYKQWKEQGSGKSAPSRTAP